MQIIRSLRFRGALRLRAFGQRRNRTLARFGQRAVELLAPVRDITTGAIHINHVHRFVASVGQLVEHRRRHENRLTCFDRAALGTDANLTFALNDKINFFLLLVVPRHLDVLRDQRVGREPFLPSARQTTSLQKRRDIRISSHKSPKQFQRIR